MQLNRLNRLLLFFFLISNVHRGMAQDTLNSVTVEQKSFQLYQDKKWPELIKFGKLCVKKGFDYFYLEMRIGIAYYERKNYAKAAVHFRKALNYNTTDDVALEYLYYCYFFNGKYEEARKLSKKFSTALAAKIGTDKASKINFVTIEGGTKKSDSTDYYNKGTKSTSNFFNPAVYFQVGLSHTVKNSVSVFHAATLFNQKSFLGSNRQLQYYLKVSVPIKSGWLISPSVQLVNKRNAFEVKSPPNNPGQGGPGQMGPPPKPKQIITKSTGFLGSLEIKKTLQKFDISIGTTCSSLDSGIQYYHFGGLSYAPFGNSKLILGCTAYFHTIDNYATTNTAIAPYLFLAPAKWLSLTASYFQNKGNNIIEGNGYLVNNSPDLTSSRWSMQANFSLNKHLSLYGLYQLEYKTEAVQHFNYQYNLIVAGLKIIP